MNKCLIIEDDYMSALDVKMQLEELDCEVVEIILEAKDILSSPNLNKVDLILSDIKLGNDVFAFDILKEHSTLPPIIFFSSYNDQKLYERSMELEPYIYLIKPLDITTLRSAINGALKNANPNYSSDLKMKSGNVFIRSKGKLISITPSKIKFIFSEGNYCYINYESSKFVIRSSIKNILATLSFSRLQQVHRAYVVNTDYISSVDIKNDTIHLNGVEVPVGRSFKKKLINRLKLN